MKQLLSATLCFFILLATPLVASAQQAGSGQSLSLITANPDEGFDLAVKLARRAVSTTQPDRKILMKERKDYSEDADSLIAVSHVVAVYFQTIAQANNYWND